MPTSPLASLKARIGAYSLHASRDSREVTAPARAGFLQKFIDQVDPHRRLSERERQRRAQAALKAHMASLSYRSAKVRAERAARRRNGGADDAAGAG